MNFENAGSIGKSSEATFKQTWISFEEFYALVEAWSDLQNCKLIVWKGYTAF